MQADILLVLGPPALRLGTEEALRERGYSVVAVVNGEQALAALLINRPDLVLLDLQLPDVSGLELAKQARNTLGHQRTPMMALGNEADIAASAHELSSIFSTVLQKPLEAKEIADAVQSLLPLRTERRGFSEKGHVVLVVDDDTMHRRLLFLQLQREGFVVLLAADGNEALRVARRYRPAVVLADLRMPNMDGFQLAREMSEDLMLSTIPVVLITASLDAHPNLPTAESLGVVAIVEKSPNPKGLVQTIWTAIRRNSPPPRPVQEKTPALPKVEVAPAAVTEMKELIRLQNAQLSVLAGISSALVDQQDMHEVLKEAVAWCLDLSFVRKGAAWVVLPGRGLQLAATEGWSPAEVMVLEELVQDSSVTANLWQNDPVILRAQAGHHPAAASRLARLDVATLVVVPLQRGPEHLGLIAMASSDEGLRRMGYSLGRAVQGQLCQAILLSRTISELRDAERQLEEVADYSRDSVMITNQAGRIIYANPRACSVLDIPKARLVGRYIHDFIQPWAPESASWDALLSTPDIRPRTVRVSTRHTGLHRQLRTHILWETDPALSLPGVDRPPPGSPEEEEEALEGPE